MSAENINPEKKDRRTYPRTNNCGFTNSTQDVTHAGNERYVAQETLMKKTARFAKQGAKAAATFFRPMFGGIDNRGQQPDQPLHQVVLPNGTTQPNKSNGSEGEWICQFVGLSGDQDPFVLRHCSFNHLNCYKAPDWAILRVKGDNDIPLHFTVVPDSHLDARPSYYPTTDTEAIVRPYSEDLLRTYFEVVHSSYPLLEPSRFNSPPETGDPLLAVMYNLASPFCPDTPPTFQKLSDFVHQALPIERRHPRLETIEACLLFLQRHNTVHRAPTLPGLWGDIGTICGMAHDLGLNMNPSAWSLSPSDANRRVRIWWALYIQDKWSALGLGRPSYLNDDHCNVPMITIDAFSHTTLHNEPTSLTPALQFVAMAHLTSILSNLLSTFYTLKAIDRIKLLPIEVLYSIMDEFQTRLLTFQDDHLCQLYNVNTLLDSSGSVTLAFYTVEIVLYRAVLRFIPMGHPGYAGVRAQAKTTVLNLVSFLEKLHVSQLRAFWWSPMTRINFALCGTFMFFQLLTSITSYDIEFWSSTISHYRSLLRLQSHSFDMTKLACVRMDLLAQGMGVDPPQSGNEALEQVMEHDAVKKLVLTPGSAEEWIARQGHGGMLLC
ncbi:Transcriptional activator protein DAL81 [Lachnellula suecica]|uniref:Transcriptional activator protein DAL81 n=1 Tax=Lachnellula suecica TaxID=602035 RepID=A0A8T9C4Q4_9HELO|nr:Transcriptional activator protein DAL81 [Lachnellula suecica]